jgi:hypothetical protein
MNSLTLSDYHRQSNGLDLQGPGTPGEQRVPNVSPLLSTSTGLSLEDIKKRKQEKQAEFNNMMMGMAQQYGKVKSQDTSEAAARKPYMLAPPRPQTGQQPGKDFDFVAYNAPAGDTVEGFKQSQNVTIGEEKPTAVGYKPVPGESAENIKENPMPKFDMAAVNQPKYDKGVASAKADVVKAYNAKNKQPEWFENMKPYLPYIARMAAMGF